MDRRDFLRKSALATGAIGTVSLAELAAHAAPAQPGPGPYGELQPPDANGIMLPKGFTSRVIARSLTPVGATGYIWHGAPDGGATYSTPDGGWVYTSNSEVPGGRGGAGAVRFDKSGAIVDAYSILTGTSGNCAGGKTPWGTWLSCEETDTGRVWETDPLGEKPAVVMPALGVFAHEAVAVDPLRKQLYLTEDKGDGRFYRFTPTAYPNLSAGRLEVLAAAGDRGPVRWLAVPDPSAASATTRTQVPDSKAFKGGEGVWYDAGFIYFTTKGDNKVWVYDVVDATLDVLYDAAALEDAPLTGVDNIVVSQSGDIVVAEDGGDLDLVLITPDRVVSRLVKVTGQDASELCGPAFDPSGRRLYFSSQRGGAPVGPGITYEVTGPFRTARPSGVTPPAPVRPANKPAAPTPVLASPHPLAATGVPSVAATAGLGLVAAALAFRRRTEA